MYKELGMDEYYGQTLTLKYLGTSSSRMEQ